MHSFAPAPAQSQSPQRPPQPARPRIAPANDRSEVEAERAAERVADGKAAGPLGKAPPLSLNRKCNACDAEDSEALHRREKTASARQRKAREPPPPSRR